MSWIVGFRRNLGPCIYIRAWDLKNGLPTRITNSRRKAMIFDSMASAIDAMKKTPISATMIFIEEQLPYDGRG